MKRLLNISSADSDLITETERFIAYADEYGSMAIRPVKTSGLWEHILEHDWWFMFNERPELDGVFKLIHKEFKKAKRRHESDVFNVYVTMEYNLRQPPGVGALQWGHHLGTTGKYMFKADPPKQGGKGTQLQFVTGFVRMITMEPLG